MSVTLLRDVINIPERAGAEDYVLRLTDVGRAQRGRRARSTNTSSPSAGRGFDAALGLVAEAITSGDEPRRVPDRLVRVREDRTSWPCCTPCCEHEPAARAKAELQPVIARHDAVLADRKVLPLAFHLLGARSRWSRPSSAATSARSASCTPGRRCRRCTSPTRFSPTPSVPRPARRRAVLRRAQRRAGGEDGGAADPWAAVLGARDLGR